MRAKPTNLNTTSIVCYLQQLQPTLLGQDVQRGSTGIDGILNKFLERVDRSNYDFTSCDFVDNILIERLGLCQWLCLGACVRRWQETTSSSCTHLDSARRTSFFRQALGLSFCSTWYDIVNLIGAWDTSHVHICVCCHCLWPIAIEPPSPGA
jgi:hypothetical protein